MGATITPKLLLGFDISGVGASASQNGVTESVAIANYDAMVTFFPVGHGPFLRGGLGVSRFSDTLSGAMSGTFSCWGGNLDLGVGYAFWLGRSFNLTVNLDWSGQSWGDHAGGTTGPQTSSFWALGFGFDWY